MASNKIITTGLAALTLSFTLSLTIQISAHAQNSPNGLSGQVSMTLLPTMNDNGTQYIVTPKGFKVALPGSADGIAKDAKAVAVYQDAQSNYWYINKHGQPTEVKPETVQSIMSQVQVMQRRAGGPAMYGQMPMQPYPQMNQGYPAQYQGPPPGYYPPQAQAPAQPPTQQTTIVQQPSDNNGSNAGTSALGAGMGAMAGAALGAAMWGDEGGGYYGVPYGHPVYAEGGNHYYYNNSGNKAYVNANANNQKYFDEMNKQGNWQDRDNWSRNLQPNSADAANRAQNAGQARDAGNAADRGFGQNRNGSGFAGRAGRAGSAGGGFRGFGGRRGR